MLAGQLAAALLLHGRGHARAPAGLGWQAAVDVMTGGAHLCLLTPFCPSTPRSDTAMLLDKVGQAEAAVDYATGALVNAQVGQRGR